MVLPSSSRGGAVIDWVALHSAEGARTVESLFGFFDRNQNSSSHAGADGYRLSEPWVPDDRAAWTLLNGNPRSLNIELCAFAHWTRAQWLSEGWVEGVWNPRQMIRNAAAWVRQKCDRHNIPKRLLTPEQVGRGERGIIDHARYTYGTGDGNHTDVGVNFPWDVFMADVLGSASPDANEDGDIDMRLVKGDKKPEIYVVTFTGEGVQKRHIRSMAELELIRSLSGLEVRSVPQGHIDTISTESLIGGAVWNYKIPTEDSNTPSDYRPAHRLFAGVSTKVGSIVTTMSEMLAKMTGTQK